MTIPSLPGVMIDENRPSLPPERMEVITRPLRLRVLGLAGPVLLLAVGAATFLLLHQMEVRKDAPSRDRKEGPMTFDRLGPN